MRRPWRDWEYRGGNAGNAESNQAGGEQTSETPHGLSASSSLASVASAASSGAPGCVLVASTRLPKRSTTRMPGISKTPRFAKRDLRSAGRLGHGILFARAYSRYGGVVVSVGQLTNATSLRSVSVLLKCSTNFGVN